MGAPDTALRLARPLLAPWIAVAATCPASDHDALTEEITALGGASRKRQQEFRAGRAAAHRAMESLGLARAPVLSGDDRAPIWPDGLTGAISHSNSACLAAIARDGPVRAIGIDVEDATALEPELWSTICTGHDMAQIGRAPAHMAGLLAKLVFCAKECAYKAQYSLSRTLFGFDMFDIDLNLHRSDFTARFRDSVPGFASSARLGGRFAIKDGVIVTTLTILR